MGYRDKLPPKPLVQFYAAAPVHILSAVDTLKYESEVMAAPTVVAKGVDDVAKRIREVAEEHGIPIMANPPLARALHAMVEVDREIPIEHYKAVAEIIGYVMGLKDRGTSHRAAR